MIAAATAQPAGTLTFIPRGSGVAYHRDRDIRIGRRGRAAGAVDHVEDPALAVRRIEEDRQEVPEAPGGQGLWDHERVRGEDVDPLVEEAVAAHAVAVEARHAVGDLEGGVAGDAGRLAPRG